MLKQTSVKRLTIKCSLRNFLLGLAVLVASSFTGILFNTSTTTAATNSTINFQARLLTSSGALVPDGNYNVEFKLYNALTSSGSSQGSCSGDSHCLWVETRTTTNQVRVANGYLTVNLGDVQAFSTSLNWSQNLYLTMNIGGTSGTPSWDGEMSPRIQLTATPYALPIPADQVLPPHGSPQPSHCKTCRATPSTSAPDR